MQSAIQKAIEVGYEIAPKIWGTPTIHAKKTAYREFELIFPYGSPRQTAMRIYKEKVLLDPLFWQALGKALGWDTDAWFYNNLVDGMVRGKEYIEMWHRFIDHLAEGKDAESFFNELLK